MDKWMDGWMDGWMHGWMDGWMDVICVFSIRCRCNSTVKQTLISACSRETGHWRK